MVSESGLTARMILLCIWWGWQGITYYEVIPYGHTFNSELYSQQLNRLKEENAH